MPGCLGLRQAAIGEGRCELGVWVSGGGCVALMDRKLASADREREAATTAKTVHRSQTSRSETKTFSLENILLFALPVAILLGIGLWFASRFVQPAPPSNIVISTGSKSGGYYAFGQAYRKILARSGIDLKVRVSKGTVENLKLLADPDSGVSVALVQGGVAKRDKAKDFLSLGRIFYEPLWVFYRGRETFTTLPQLVGRRIAIGPVGSGTRSLALRLLKANGINAKAAQLLPISGRSAVAALRNWRVDAIFVVASLKSKLVRELLHDPNIRLMSFARASAYARRLPFLARLELPRGVIDLVNNVPPRDVQLIAPVAALVVRKELHGALASLLAEAAAETHNNDGIFQKAGEFPQGHDPVFAMSPDAARIYKSGVPFLRRYLPFWMVVWIQRLIVLVVPLLTIMLPLMKIVPLIYRWQMRRRILRWYLRLKDLEEAVSSVSGPQQLRENLTELERIDARVREMSVPLAFTDDLYTLRQHIELIRNKLLDTKEMAASPIG